MAKTNRTKITAAAAADAVYEWNRITRAMDLLKAEKAKLAAAILESGDVRFEIVEAHTRESAPSKANYIALHGQAAFDQNKATSLVKTYVKGVKA